ncbi:MAG: adenosylcobinamide-phosphate synthase CbiB [Rhodospirillaceae bacterium]
MIGLSGWDHSLAVLAVAMIIDGVAGYPQALVRRLGHPVIWIGAVIAALDAGLNRPDRPVQRRRCAGVLALFGLLALVAVVTVPLALACRALPFGWALEALLASTLLAQKSLAGHVAAVAEGLRGGLAAGRLAVARIVGRDPETLDEPAVARAAIESLAENFSDGVVAPALWLLLGGLPAIALYKAINTADSMIGHRTPRHEAFGWAAARLDDLVNLPGARLTALLLAAAAALSADASAEAALAAAWRDAPSHRSPNAGWPEAAMAGALGLSLAGPRVYGGVVVEDAWMGDGRPAATADDIDAALALHHRAWLIALVLAAAGWACRSGGVS